MATDNSDLDRLRELKRLHKSCRRFDCHRAPSPTRKDGYCSARCQRKDRWDDIQMAHGRHFVEEP